MEHTLHRVMCKYFCTKVNIFFTLSMENVVFSDEVTRLSFVSFMPKKKGMLRSINSNDNERDLRCAACAGCILQVQRGL